MRLLSLVVVGTSAGWTLRGKKVLPFGNFPGLPEDEAQLSSEAQKLEVEPQTDNEQRMVQGSGRPSIPIVEDLKRNNQLREGYPFPLYEEPSNLKTNPYVDTPESPLLDDLEPIAPENKPEEAPGGRELFAMKDRPLYIPPYLYPEQFPNSGVQRTYPDDGYFQSLCGAPKREVKKVKKCSDEAEEEEATTPAPEETTTLGPLMIKAGDNTPFEMSKGNWQEKQVYSKGTFKGTKYGSNKADEWRPKSADVRDPFTGNPMPHAFQSRGQPEPWEQDPADAEIFKNWGHWPPQQAVAKPTKPKDDPGPCIKSGEKEEETTPAPQIRMSTTTTTTTTKAPAEQKAEEARQALCAQLYRTHRTLLAPKDSWKAADYPLAAPADRLPFPVVAPRDFIPQDYARFVDQVANSASVFTTVPP